MRAQRRGLVAAAPSRVIIPSHARTRRNAPPRRNPLSLQEQPQDVPELCSRLLREANAKVVMVLGTEGEILGHSGKPGALADAVLDAVADATARALLAASEGTQADEDHVQPAGKLQVCAAPLGVKAVLVVVYAEAASLPLVRARMKRAREQILRVLIA